MNGDESCLRIRQASRLPILALGSRDETMEMLELGADAFMMKPINFSELTARVRALLRRRPNYNPPEDNLALEAKEYLRRKGRNSKEKATRSKR